MKTNTFRESDRPAGRFYPWLQKTIFVIKNRGESDVPCEACSACCNSSYFVHITPNDIEAVKRIPKKLTFSAPGLPKGHLLLGYDENGRCPMFVDNKCSIYEFRPQTCRQYDCRIFPATGIEINERDKKLIANQAKRWEFEFSNKQDREAFLAVQTSARFIHKNAAHFPGGFLPSNPTQQAVLAIAVSDIFLDPNASNNNIAHTVKLIVSSCKP